MKVSFSTSTLVFLLLFMLSATEVVAQPDGPPAPTPFGFVEVLIAAGAVLGGKKVYDYQKQSK